MLHWIQAAWQTLAQITAPETSVQIPAAQTGAVQNATVPTADPAMAAGAHAAVPAALNTPPGAASDTPLPDTESILPRMDAPADAGQSLVEMNAHSGILDFVQQSDWVGQGLFAILVVMSFASWYPILYKWLMNWRTKRRSERFLRTFWNASSLEQVEQEISLQGAREPFANLASHAIHARNHHAAYGAVNLQAAGSTNAFVTRTIRKCIDEETSRLENGLTVLASVGSTAPFVGLFGTVWGVYHALLNIGMSDGVTINRIAGPVGEALIMTGLGLAVAIPAVLAYNFFVRGNRVYLGRLDAFAHDLFTFLTTGQQQFNGRNARNRREPSVQAKG